MQALPHRVAAASALVLLSACATQRGPGAQPTPQRPTLSHNTQTTALGTYELEAGVEIDPQDFIDTPMLMKYGVTDRTEFVFGGSPLRRIDSPKETGLGDVVLGARHRIVDETAADPAIAVATLIKLPIADRDKGLGSGETDVRFSIAAQKQIDQVNAVGYYALGLLGAPNSDGLDLEHDLALAASTPIDQNLDAFAELGGVFIPEYDYESVFLTTGGAFTLGPASVFDVGVRVGLTPNAPDFIIFFGVTHNFGASTVQQLSPR